jgi:hypothetical protein
MHTHIYSLKLGPGFILLAKVCPWKSTFLDLTFRSIIDIHFSTPFSIEALALPLSFKKALSIKPKTFLRVAF